MIKCSSPSLSFLTYAVGIGDVAMMRTQVGANCVRPTCQVIHPIYQCLYLNTRCLKPQGRGVRSRICRGSLACHSGEGRNLVGQTLRSRHLHCGFDFSRTSHRRIDRPQSQLIVNSSKVHTAEMEHYLVTLISLQGICRGKRSEPYNLFSQYRT